MQPAAGADPPVVVLSQTLEFTGAPMVPIAVARSLQVQASVIGLHGLGGHAAAAVEEHAAIYRAIRDGEPEAAAEATSVHLDNTLEDYRREIQRRVFG